MMTGLSRPSLKLKLLYQTWLLQENLDLFRSVYALGPNSIVYFDLGVLYICLGFKALRMQL